jgi:3-oxoacyl-[acyl-carrier protein] reductase
MTCPTPLQGKIALVTGAATGIGAAIAQALAGAGATLVINHPGDQEYQATAVTAAITRLGGQAVTVKADLTQSDQVTTMAREVLDQFGMVHILVNNAGDYPRIAWPDLDEHAWASALELNLTAHYRCIRAFTDPMVTHRDGRIINIGSITARSGRVGLAAYGAAKAGLHGLTRCLARELGPHGVCVNTIVPGPIQVDRELELPATDRTPIQMQLARQCLPRRGQPDDVAAAAVFLAGPGAGFITGQSLHIDGGWLLH